MTKKTEVDVEFVVNTEDPEHECVTAYYPLSDAARKFFERFFAEDDGGYVFEEAPDYIWLKRAGLRCRERR